MELGHIERHKIDDEAFDVWEAELERLTSTRAMRDATHSPTNTKHSTRYTATVLYSA